MKIKQQIDFVIRMLGYLKSQIELANTIHFFDLNTASEDFFVHFLNLVWNVDLVNRNKNQPNAVAIDLEDQKARVSIQVTSDNSSTKIIETIDKFKEAGLESNFDKLIILSIKNKKKYTTQWPSCKAEVKILDLKDLHKEISNLDGPILEKVVHYLNDQFGGISQTMFLLKSRSLTIPDLQETTLDKKVHEALSDLIPRHKGNHSLWAATDSLFFEILKNAVVRSETSSVELTVDSSHLTMKYDGNEYNPNQILIAKNKRGGYSALTHFMATYPLQVALSYNFESNKNNLVLSKAEGLTDGDSFNICRVDVTRQGREDATVKFNPMCKKKFLYVAKYEYHSSNVNGYLTETIKKIGKPYKEILVLVPDGKENVDLEFRELFPGLTIQHYKW